MCKKLTPASHLSFITGGNAYFTMKNRETEVRFTYHVAIPDDQKPETARIWFVGLLTGTDNTSDYSYIGYLRRSDTGKFYFTYGKKSGIKSDAAGVVAFTKVFNGLLANGLTLPKLEIWHEGRCCRCGRKLTVPESIESGIGPECAKIAGAWKHAMLENS